MHIVMFKPIFTRLSNDDLLNRCLKGLTQNQNEAANGVLWSKCPKRKFYGLNKVKLAFAQTVSEFNTGNCATAHLQLSMDLEISRNSLGSLRKLDTNRIKNAAKKISAKARLTRRKAQAKKKSKVDQKQTYIPGGFGTSKEPELDFVLTGKKNKGSKKMN